MHSERGASHGKGIYAERARGEGRGQQRRCGRRGNEKEIVPPPPSEERGERRMLVTSTAADIAVDCLCYRVRRGRQRPRSVERRGGPGEARERGTRGKRHRGGVGYIYTHTHSIHHSQTHAAAEAEGGEEGGSGEHGWNERTRGTLEFPLQKDESGGEDESGGGKFDDALLSCQSNLW